MVFLPFSYIVGASANLPRPFAYCGILIGATFVLLGFFSLLYPLQMIVDILSTFQGLWWLTAAIATLMSGRQGRLTPLTESSTTH